MNGWEVSTPADVVRFIAGILENLENKEAEIQAKLRRQKGKGEKKTIEKQW